MEYNPYYRSLYSGYLCPPQPPPPAAEDSLSDLLGSDSRLFLDQVVNSAFSIVYRLRMHQTSMYDLDHAWGDLRTKSLALDSGPLGNSYTQKRITGLESEVLRIEQQRREEKLALWKDLRDVTGELIGHFHNYQALRQEKQLLGE